MTKLKKIIVGATSLFLTLASSLSLHAKPASTNLTVSNYRNFIVKFEGKTNSPYKDKFGNWTVGIGHNLNAGGKKVAYKSHYTEKEINTFFEEDLSRCLNVAKNKIWDFDKRPDNVKLTVVSLIFNVGEDGFCKFKRFISAINNKDYARASRELEHSLWAKQVPGRAEHHIAFIKKNSINSFQMSHVNQEEKDSFEEGFTIIH